MWAFYMLQAPSTLAYYVQSVDKWLSGIFALWHHCVPFAVQH